MTNKQLVIEFVGGASKGRSLHMFIDGDVIYSYGYHWPLALRQSKGKGQKIQVFYLNKDKYSQTTSRHTSLLKQEIQRRFFGSRSSSYQELPHFFLNEMIFKHKEMKCSNV